MQQPFQITPEEFDLLSEAVWKILHSHKSKDLWMFASVERVKKYLLTADISLKNRMDGSRLIMIKELKRFGLNNLCFLSTGLTTPARAGLTVEYDSYNLVERILF